MKKNEESKVAQENQGLLKNYSVIFAAIIVVLAGIHTIRAILGPIFLAIFFSILLISPIKWLRAKGISPWLALTSVIVAVIASGVMVATLIATQLTQFAENIPEYRDRFNDVLASYNLGIKVDEFLPEFLKSEDKSQEENTEKESVENSENARTAEQCYNVRSSAFTNESNGVVKLVSDMEPAGTTASSQVVDASASEGSNADVAKDVTLQNETSDETQQEASETSRIGIRKSSSFTAGAAAAVDTSSQELFRFLSRLAADLSYFGSNAFLVVLMLIFILCETANIPGKLIAVLGEKRFKNSNVEGVLEDIRKYMVIKTFLSVLVAASATLVLIVSKVQYPFLWGFVVFLLEFIPNLGSVVSAIPPVVLATIDHGLIVGGVDAVCFAAINCIFGYVVEPKLLGNGLNLSPLVVLISLIFFGWLLGPVGMFLSPPLAVVTKLFFQSFSETRWLAALMSEQPPTNDVEAIPEGV